MAEQKITLIRLRKPKKDNINKELQWLGLSLGLFSMRDKDKSCFRIFIELLKATKKGKKLSSDDLAYKLKLSRGTVVYHLNKLSESGIVLHEKKGYILRVDMLSDLIEEIERDIKRTCDDLKDIAEHIDKSLSF